MSRRRPRPLSTLKDPPPPKAPAPQLTPQQRQELEQIKGRRERALYLLRFLNQPQQNHQSSPTTGH